MRLPRNTHLPQPTAPSPLASLSLILAWTVLFTQYAFTAKENSIGHEGHNHPRLNGAQEVDAGHGLETYEPEFTGADRSIIGRAGEVNQTLANNAPGIRDIIQGTSQYWNFPNATLFGPKTPQAPGLPSYFKGQNVSAIPDDPSEVELYISLTTCRLPLAKDPNSDSVPDQLKLYVSTSSTNQQPDENQYDHAVPVEGGFGWLNISTKNGVYFGVYAPANEDYDGVYNYQLTASIDGFYASLYSDLNFSVHFVDSDINSALLYTTNLTDNTSTSDPVFQQWMGRSQVFSLFLQNKESPSILGLQNSVCGLQNLAQIKGSDVETAMTAAGDGLPKQRFYVKNLNRSSTYNAVLAINSTDPGRGVVGGGGTVWNSANLRNFTTKSFENCALLFDLPFCTSVAYAVPANPRINTTQLLQHYDQYANSSYQNFTYSLQQIPCNTTSSAQYSLARNCNDCDAAYKQWLCAVTIPRCADLSNRAPYLQPRAVNYQQIPPSSAILTDGDPAFIPDMGTKVAFSSSRNPMIDAVIKPGPYKELLPCEDICYNLIRSCPAALQFACPLEGHGLNYSYGKPQGDSVTCNRPWTLINEAAGLRVTGVVAFYAALAAAAAFMVTTL